MSFVNIAVSTASFGRAFQEGKLAVVDFPEVCDGFGLEAIELNDFCIKADREIVKALKRGSTRFGIAVCAVAVESNFYRDEEIERDREHLREYFDIAYHLGAPLLRVDTCPYGKGLPESIMPEGVTHDMAFDRAVTTFRSLVSDAEAKGITMVVENHGGISRTSADQVRLVEAVGSEWFRINLDTGNYHADPMAGLDPFEDVLDAIDTVAPYLAFCHAKIWDVTDDLREPTLDYDRIFERFHAHGYRGPVSIEYMGGGDAMEIMPRCVQMLKRRRDRHS